MFGAWIISPEAQADLSIGDDYASLCYYARLNFIEFTVNMPNGRIELRCFSPKDWEKVALALKGLVEDQEEDSLNKTINTCSEYCPSVGVNTLEGWQMVSPAED